MFIPSYRPTLVAAACSILAGCIASPPKTPDPLIFDRSKDLNAARDLRDGTGATPIAKETAMHTGPRPPEQISGNLRPPTPATRASEEAGDITVSLEQMPLGNFIQAVYGGILGMNYSIDASINARPDLVTFRTPKPISAARLQEVSGQLLKSYGIAVQDFGGLLRITPSTSISSTLPLIRRGRAQPSVPLPLRPIFHYVETEAVKPETFMPTLKSMLSDKVKVETTQQGGLLISGQPEDVQVALELVQVFDQPTLRGQNNMRVVPRFWGAEEFARRLGDVLKAEGYAVSLQAGSNEPITLLPLPPINSVLIFASSKEALAHVVDWVKELDQLTAVQAGSAFFTYPVRNADAQELAKALNDLIGTSTSTTQTQPVSSGSSTSSSSAPGAQTPRQRRVVVNNATNSLIFQGGSQEDYRQWLSLLSELDKPVKSAMIDVLVAEVTLKDDNDLGFSWKLDQLGSGASAVTLSGTTYGVNANGDGLKINALLGGNPLRQLAINALASNSESRVISNPKIITRNGEAANINVGQEVPTVTSQAVTSNGGFIGGNNNVVPQTVQYRNTGVLLRVRPVIHSGDRIDLEVSQEVSSAESTVTGVTTSPTFRKRSVETKLTLRDGATVMLGGLISENHTNSDAGVPLLKDIPLLGNLFKSSKVSRDRTEMIMLITPYILNDSADAEAATDAYQNTLSEWSQSVRDRINAARKARQAHAETQVSPSPAKPVTERTGAATTDAHGAPKAVQPEAPSPAAAPPAPAPSTPPPLAPAPSTSGASGSRMINISGRTADVTQPPSANTPNTPAAAASPAASAPADAASAPPAPPKSSKSAPDNIGGVATPAGATVVEDPELLKQLREAFKR
ncbi:secretin N-terminal domain-containing protein [Comamonas composti]|uniref:secretin N-terminal domain-containing protein n=1 Tax=Comamonas composti TaxID=408558 RepID=UPI00146FC4B2|nr:secretin N-terminal domain-containing protein [Comamonas composti]